MLWILFLGVMASGSWACLDEFNRLDVEVLSVVAQQLLHMRHTILNAQGSSVATEMNAQTKVIRILLNSFCASGIGAYPNLA